MRTINIVRYTFTLIGALLIAGAGYFYFSTQAFLASAAVTQGVVVELIRNDSSDSTTYTPVVEFTANNEHKITYTASFSSNPPAYDIGEIVEVYYDKKSPNDARLNGLFALWGAPMIMGALGLIFFSIGFGMILFSHLKARKKEDLLKTGQVINANVTSIHRNTSYKVNGQSPYVIVAQWQNPNGRDIYKFQSDSIWFDPTDFVKTDTVPVYIEIKNPKRYYMDIGFLPKLA